MLSSYDEFAYYDGSKKSTDCADMFPTPGLLGRNHCGNEPIPRSSVKRARRSYHTL
jgi:hypothetical protein